MDDDNSDLKFSREQKDYIDNLAKENKHPVFDFDHLTDDDVYDITNLVGDRVVGLVDDDMLRPYPPEVTMCYSILDYLGEH